MSIQFYADINESHAATGFTGRTDLPAFHIFTIEETYPSTRKVMPPYRFGFYQVVLLEQSADALLTMNTDALTGLSDSISSASPQHLLAWVRGAAQRGYILYFKPEFLNPHLHPVEGHFISGWIVTDQICVRRMIMATDTTTEPAGSTNAEPKIVLVTGANRGIGFEAARQLAQQGYTVWIGARDEEKGQTAAATLQAEGLAVNFIQLDTTDSASIQQAAQRIEAEVGKLDALINNAAVFLDWGYPRFPNTTGPAAPDL